MLKRYLTKLEKNIIAGRNLCLQKSSLFFLSSVLVGISSAFAVIVLKSFAHQVFSFATYINGILKLSFINSIYLLQV
jgi:CIC family chloride channel protein